MSDSVLNTSLENFIFLCIGHSRNVTSSLNCFGGRSVLEPCTVKHLRKSYLRKYISENIRSIYSELSSYETELRKMKSLFELLTPKFL